MNLKLITIDRLREFLNKFSKVATSGNYNDLSDVPTKVSQFTNDAGYAKITDIPTYTAGKGIKIENGVISIIGNKIGDPIAYGYTLHGDYFLSNNIITNVNWQGACAITSNVVVTQYYTFGSQSKIVTARTLSKAELKTINSGLRKHDKWYWTSTYDHDSLAWIVYSDGDIRNYTIDTSSSYGGARLGFENPF